MRTDAPQLPNIRRMADCQARRLPLSDDSHP